MVKKVIFAAIFLTQVPLWADAPVPSAAPAVSSASAGTPTPISAAAASADPAMNEMSGSVLSVDSDSKVIRLTLDGGYSVEFSYDSLTKMVNGGHIITAADLNYGDKVTIRYIGKDLIAREIERTSRAPAIVPSPAPPDVVPPSVPANNTPSTPQ